MTRLEEKDVVAAVKRITEGDDKGPSLAGTIRDSTNDLVKAINDLASYIRGLTPKG